MSVLLISRFAAARFTKLGWYLCLGGLRNKLTRQSTALTFKPFPSPCKLKFGTKTTLRRFSWILVRLVDDRVPNLEKSFRSQIRTGLFEKLPPLPKSGTGCVSFVIFGGRENDAGSPVVAFRDEFSTKPARSVVAVRKNRTPAPDSFQVSLREQTNEKAA